MTRHPPALVVLAAAWLAACGQPPSPPAATIDTSAVPGGSAATSPSPGAGSAAAGLVILAGEPPVLRVSLVDAGGRAVALAAPDGLAWLSASGSGALLATLRDGRLALGTVTAGAAAWRPVRFDPSALDHVPARAAVSPDAATAAVLAADAASPDRFELAAVDLASGGVVASRIAEALDGLPVWLDARRIAIRTTGGAGRHLRLVDATSGALGDGPVPAGDVGVATRAGIVVGLRDATGELFIRPLDDWLARGDADAPVLPVAGSSPDEVGIASFAIDPDAARLAVAWLDALARPSVVVVYTAAGSWREAARFPTPGAAAPVLGWLR